MNERTYQMDGMWVKSPLASVFMASNEYPNDDDSGIDSAAFFDRCTIRKEVRAVRTKAGLDRLLGIRFLDEPADKAVEPIGSPVFDHKLTADELAQAHDQARQIPWSRDAGNTLIQIFRELNDAGIIVSDRRKRKAVGIAQAAAWLAGAAIVDPEHLEVLQHTLWDQPGEQVAKTAKIVIRLANPVRTILEQSEREIELIEEQVNVKQDGAAEKACEKLAEIRTRLSGMKPCERREELMQECNEAMTRVRLKYLRASR
jgi:MoxR-like ATPase